MPDLSINYNRTKSKAIFLIFTKRQILFFGKPTLILSARIDNIRPMVDIVNPAKRSEMMSRVRGADTKPELIVRSVLHRLGYRFRLHQKDLPGKPDIVLSKHGAVIFVHGCFWHQHIDCKRSHVPKSNKEYWVPKLERNVARDKKCREQLEADGWRVLVVWECEAADQEMLSRHLNFFLNDGS